MIWGPAASGTALMRHLSASRCSRPSSPPPSPSPSHCSVCSVPPPPLCIPSPQPSAGGGEDEGERQRKRGRAAESDDLSEQAGGREGDRCVRRKMLLSGDQLAFQGKRVITGGALLPVLIFTPAVWTSSASGCRGDQSPAFALRSHQACADRAKAPRKRV